MKRAEKLDEQDTREATARFDHGFVNAFTGLVQLMSPPAIFLAGVLGFWRLGADLRWTGEFPIASGVFSRYQVWFALSIGLYLSASALKRRTANQTTDSKFPVCP